ncbi:WD domain G-beta repeat [Carpediemonas membranifera]|uniref:WD domain G-beta repeat n=1 Tax=Carpediemonas membranifera TaxID=201153 RepID=A0A8J6DYI6_9EUKA|nr:WD domain G-beta repeat [Carpediemonas membranifera]|eukprot:KAG9392304.1 WD domain G-beta repeat [Carpediemonas membranifera]
MLTIPSSAFQISCGMGTTIMMSRANEPKIFAAREAEADNFLHEFRSFRDARFSILASQQDASTQMSNGTEESFSQTNWVPSVNDCTQYQLPEFSQQDLESRLNDPALFQFISHASDQVESALFQNERDVWGPFLTRDEDDDFELGGGSHTGLEEKQSFSHLAISKGKMLSCARWMPGHKDGAVAVSCSDAVPFNVRAGSTIPEDAHVLIWSFKDPIKPLAILVAPNNVETLEFSPNGTHLAGGLSSGQICIWSAEEAIATTTADIPIEPLRMSSPFAIAYTPFGHVGQVTALTWLSNTTFVSVADDGTMCTWDVAKEVDGMLVPTAQTALMEGEAKFFPTAVATTRIAHQFDLPEGFADAEEFVHSRRWAELEHGHRRNKSKADPEAEPPACTNILVAGFDGVISPLPTAVIAGPQLRLPRPFNAHEAEAPILSVQPAPLVRSLLLTCTPVSFSIWDSGVPFPVYTSPPMPGMLTGAIWSESRPAVVIVSRVDGVVDLWDLLDRTHEPYISSPVAMSAITALSYAVKVRCPDATGRGTHLRDIIAAGDDKGALHALEVPKILSQYSTAAHTSTQGRQKHELSVLVHHVVKEVEKTVYVKQWQ